MYKFRKFLGQKLKKGSPPACCRKSKIFTFRGGQCLLTGDLSGKATRETGDPLSLLSYRLVLLDDVAVARAAMCRDGDCRNSFDVTVMGNGEAAIGGLRNCHDLHEVAQLFKCDVLHATGVPLWLLWLFSGKLIIRFAIRCRQASESPRV
jgi:hypothetical protein